MDDLLLEISKNPRARGVVKRLGLPLPMPQELRRTDKPRGERPIADQEVAVWTAADSPTGAMIARVLAAAGANPNVPDDPQLAPMFDGPAQAYGRPAKTLRADQSHPLDGMVFDATSLQTPESLRALYDFFHAHLGRLAPNGRVVICGRPQREQTQGGQSNALAAAAQASLQGFMRSLAKEIGKKGATANLLYVADGADEALAGPLRFLMSARSAYVDGQAIVVDRRAGWPADDSEPAWTRSLDDKTALVTGAARGIGRKTAQLLAGEGAKVVCLDLPKDDQATSRLARDIDGGVLLCDVSAAGAAERIARELDDTYGGVDIVVNNAGITRDKTLKRMNADWWDATIDINLSAVERITTTLVDQGVLGEGGRIICLSSIAGIAGNVGQTNYSTSKAGVIGLVEHWADQYSDRRITANAIAPGFIETRMTAQMPVAMREVVRRLNNLSQGGRPIDIGQAITFLATPQAQGVTGQVLRVCGGSLVGR